tara:strand:+ start:335 stop:670 length:336 start_codon:yes stop_codon:yes gene_type:complete
VILFRIIMRIIFILIILISSSAIAKYRVLGQYECGSILSDDKDDDQTSIHMTTSWIQGYITARNYENNVRKSADPDSLYYAVVKYCKENPLDDIDDAAKDIYLQLKKILKN